MFCQAVESPLPSADALANRRKQCQRFDASLDAGGKYLCQGGLNGITGGVVNKLGHSAGADRTDIADLITQDVQGRPASAEHGLVATDPDGEFP